MTTKPAAPAASAGACRITIDGVSRVVEPGLSVAAALVAIGDAGFSRSKSGAPRGIFCGMGACHDCLVTIDGRTSQRACMSPVVDGMAVSRQSARPDIRDPGLRDLGTPPEAIPVRPVEMLVIGAGPAGLSAAATAAEAGIAVVVLDERKSGGGQFFKQPETAPARASLAEDAQAGVGAALIARARSAGVAILGQTLVWGAERRDDELRIACHGPDGAVYFAPRLLVIATGAYERVPAVPGWTLPGVMTAGAAQTLLRAYGTVPPGRVLVAGNGPLDFQIALELHKAGATVVGVVEAAASPYRQSRAALQLLAADPALALAGTRQLRRLASAGVPIHWRARVAAIRGEGRVTGASVVASGNTCEIEADTILLGGAFASDNSLSRLLGCAHDVVEGALVARRQADGESSLLDIHIIGEAGRFGGALVAQAEGELAGRAAVRKLRGTSSGDTRQALRRRARSLAFQSALWNLFRPAIEPPAPTPDTVICRCEEVTRDTLERDAASAVPDLATLKRLSRSGMGRCQGRYCSHRLGTIAGARPPASETQDFVAPQMPIRPVPLASLGVEKPEWGGHKRALLPDRAPLDGAPPLPEIRADIVVIGAGVAGVSTALFLARGGADVAILEHGFSNGVASGGNAGSLHAQLLSFDYGARAEAGGGPAARTLPLQCDSIALWGRLQQETGRDFEMKITGGLMVAETEAHLRFLEAKTALERVQGIESHVIDAAELARREPALNPDFVGAAWCPQEGKINPLVATRHLLDAASAAGAALHERCSVLAIQAEAGGFRIETSRGPVLARRIVNAAGAFAGRVGGLLNCEIPVFGAPLQMVVTEAAAPAISALVAHADRHLTLKQAANGNFIIGGGWTAGLDPVHHHPRPRLDSLEGNLWVAQHVVPGLRKVHVIRSWAAMNINIDGAPILGEDPRQKGLFHAVTSNGYTLGPIMGEMTAALVLGRDPGRDLAGFSPARFR